MPRKAKNIQRDYFKSQRAFESKLEGQVRRNKKEALKLMKGARKELERELRKVKVWAEKTQPAIERRVEKVLSNFEKKLGGQTEAQNQKAWTTGRDAGVKPLEHGFREKLEIKEPSERRRQAFERAQKGMEEDLTNALKKSVNRQVRAAVRKEITPAQAVKASGQLLRTAKKPRKIKGEKMMQRPGFAGELEKTVDTETARAYSESNHQALKETLKKVPDARKQWKTTMDGKQRHTHGRQNLEVREIEEEYTNGLQYPLDPRGPDTEVKRCRCKQRIFRKSWSEKGRKGKAS